MYAVTLFCIACAAYWWWSRKNVKITEPPCLPGAWPLLGHAPLLVGNGCDLWNRLNDFAEQSYDLGGVVSISIGPRIIYIVTDPDDSFTVATTCLDKDEFYDFTKPYIGDGLLTARYSKWKDHRKLLNPAFSQIVLDTFIGVFNSQSRKLVKDLEKEVGKGRFDHWTYIGNNALETICLTALGVDFTDPNLNKRYINALHLFLKTVLERLVKFWWHSPYTFAWSSLKKQQDACVKILHKMSDTVLQTKKSELNVNICTQKSMIPVVTDPDDSFTVATTCLDKDEFYDFTKPYIGDGLLTARYSKWKDHRKLLNPAFSQIVLDTFIGVFNSQSRKLVKDLEKEVGKGRFDHWTYIGNNALETICLTALGVDFTDPNLNKRYINALHLFLKTVLERLVKFWWHSPYTFAWSSLKKQQDACVKILHKMSDTVLQTKKSELNVNICTQKSMIPGSKFKAFLDLLLELSVEKGVFNDREVREHVDTMISAGHATTVEVLIFTMILLGSHPEAQDKVFTEIQKVLEEDKDVEKKDLSKLVYLEAVVKESLRIFTVVPALARKIDRDVKLKNCTLSAGRSCIFFLFGIHKHPIWGTDAHEFKPERWLEPGKLPDNPTAFAAFGLGKRQCIGKVYAMMSMKTTLAHVVRRYKINADYTKLRLKIDVLLKPDTGHYISLETRT